MKQVTISRKDLYDLVWKEPMKTLARKYNVSDAGLRNICNNMSIPFPKAGHWEKIKWGKPVTITPLDEKSSGQQNVTLLERDATNDNNEVLSELEILKREIENDSRLSLTVPGKLNSPDKLIIQAKESLTNKPHKDYYTGMVSTGRDELAITVSPEFVSQALRFVDTIMKAFQARGHDVFIKYGETLVVVNGEEFRICFRERAKRIPTGDKWRSTELKASGILYFKAHRLLFQKEWDNKKVPIENQISTIIACIEIEAERRRQEMEFHRKMRKEREEKEQVLREIEQKKEKELADFKAVAQEAQQWHNMTVLRNYLDVIEESYRRLNTLSEERLEWLSWVRRMADKSDPILFRINRDQ
ncbi:hypothetical protein GCM10023093_21780 [Nemorincola caseinilytica]|uniref:Uncharacterized protein n=1 Tax=Nemorincola caseinilytica TaxID=2054315 RepID=A0ABP8NJV1_9BACT